MGIKPINLGINRFFGLNTDRLFLGHLPNLFFHLGLIHKKGKFTYAEIRPQKQLFRKFI